MARYPLAVLAAVLPFLMVGAVGFAFAWPWLPRAPIGGPLLAKYAPIGNGDATLQARYDADDRLIGWVSQNVVIVPGLRALTGLSKGTRDNLTKVYGGDARGDALANLAGAQIVETRERRTESDGKLSSSTVVGVREARGDYLVSWHDDATDNEIVFDPPILAIPSDPFRTTTWETSGKAGSSLEYTFSGRVHGTTAAETALGRFDDCLNIETRYVLAQAGKALADSRGTGRYCEGVGSVEWLEHDDGGAVKSRSRLVASSRLAAEAAALPTLPPTADEAAAASDPAEWRLTRVGRARLLGDSADSTIPPLWLPTDPPLVLAAGYDSDLVAFDVSEARGTVAWRFHPDGTVFGPPAFDPERGRIYFGASDKRLYALDTRGLYLWSFQTEDNVASRPVVVDDTVIFGSEDRHVYGVDADSGALRWKYQTGGAVVSWPARAGELVVIGSDDGAVYALDPTSGDERWVYAADGPIEAPIVAADEGVYAATRDGTLALLDPESGDEVWTASLGGVVRTAPAIGDEAVFVVLDQGYLTAVRRSDGGRLWTTSQLDFSYEGWPVVVGDTILATADDGRIYRLGPDGQTLGSWSVAEASAPTDGSTFFKLGPTLAGGAVWTVDSNSVVRRLAPRDQSGPDPLTLVWVANPIGQPPFKVEFLSTPPAEYGNQAVVVDEGRNIFLLDPAGGKPTEAGTVAGEGVVVVEPIVAINTLLVQTGDTLNAVRLPGGQQLWQFKGQGTSMRPPVVAGDLALWLTAAEADAGGQASGMLHALDLATGTPRWEAPLRGLNVIGGAVARDGAAYVSTPPAAFDLATGAPRWRAAPGAVGLGGPVLSEAGDVLYTALVFPEGGAVVALDAADGRERWRAPLEAASMSPLERLWLSGDTLVVPLLDGKIAGLDAASGRERWRFEPPAPRMGAITVQADRVWLVLRNANVLALDPASGQVVERFRDLELNLGSIRALTQRPVVIGDRVLTPMSALLLGFALNEGGR